MNSTEYRALQEKLDRIAQPLKEDDIEQMDKPAYMSPEEDEILKKIDELFDFRMEQLANMIDTFEDNGLLAKMTRKLDGVPAQFEDVRAVLKKAYAVMKHVKRHSNPYP